MAMTVRRRKDVSTKKVVMHRVADIRGGVSVRTSSLGGDILLEGTLLGAPVNGICDVCKVAKVVEKATSTSIKVEKGHHFVVGDYVMSAEGGVAYAITKIDKSAVDKDTITVSTALGTLEIGSYIMQAAAQSADSSSALKVVPVAVAGTSKPVIAGDNLDEDAWVMAVLWHGDVPDAVKKYIPSIVNI